MLHVHRSDRADGLIDALRELLADPPADPFARRSSPCPTRGMERWLTQRLSTALGICANVEFPFPRRLIGRRGRGGVGDRARTRTRGCRSGSSGRCWRSSTRLGRAVAARRAWPSATTRAALRGGPPPRGAVRPLRAAPAGAGARLGGGRALAGAAVAAAAATGSPRRTRRRGSRRRARGCAASRTSSTCPSAFSLFGLTRLPAGAAATCCARWPSSRDVHLFLLHPSPALWERIAARGRGRRAARTTRRRALPRNRLLASWGQDARELQLVLGRTWRRTSTRVEHRDRHAARRACRPRSAPIAPLRARRDVDAQRPGPRLPRPRAPGRGRCATRSCTCSPTTRRSSRAT